MRLLADENFPGPAVDALRVAGHDVLWARLDMPGDDDDQILHRSQLESRILITFDKDFGELAFRAGLPAACGIALFRIPMDSPDQVARRAVAELGARNDWAGNFVVIERAKVRVRPLP